MTTSKPTDIREFWIYIGNCKNGEFDVVDTSPLLGTPEQIHVIEYHAVEQLKKEISFLKQIIQRQNTRLEIFNGMTFSENQEIIKLKEENTKLKSELDKCRLTNKSEGV